VSGTALTLITYSFHPLVYDTHIITADHRPEYPNLFIIAGVSWFVGGFFSGWIVEFEVRRRRWRFLWLAVASPAMPLWLLAVWRVAIRGYISDIDKILVPVMFLAALLGSGVGYWVGYRRRMSWKRRWTGASGERGGRRGSREAGH